MQCIACGAKIRLVRRARDETMMVPGSDHHTFECLACGEVDRGSGRVVQIGYDTDKAAYPAMDPNSGLVVARNPDRARNGVLCNSIGWRVHDSRA